MEITAIQFEKLLLEFCKKDFPPGFAIEHDYKQTGNESENKRQIDVRIKGRLGIAEILICGEAKNWSEPVGSEVIDALVGKYLSGEIRANKVILFSNMGYTEPAITRAKKLGIELLQPFTLGKPFLKIPYVISVGTLGLMMVQVVYDGIQQNSMAIDTGQYIIYKGSERISFLQMIYRNIISSLKQLPEMNVRIEVGKINVNESSVLYELKSQPNLRYNGHFNVEVDLNWDFFVEDIEDAVLFHVNEEKILHLQLLENHSIMEKVLLSGTKRNYESRSSCIINEVENAVATGFLIALSDPDQNLIDPHRPLFTII
ncbi:restriction endonuclease [Pedobacter soli]|uniref:Restriction endonuclease n=1 Tax=Pedobacter soli TaxID=390242 RepID=A0A1G6WMT1_9SPHI|nr:restriction endonuclease [Pedobacter soli]SDD66973.1 Restriction endonuclease [Pedobacter soli]